MSIVSLGQGQGSVKTEFRIIAKMTLVALFSVFLFLSNFQIFCFLSKNWPFQRPLLPTMHTYFSQVGFILFCIF